MYFISLCFVSKRQWWAEWICCKTDVQTPWCTSSYISLGLAPLPPFHRAFHVHQNTSYEPKVDLGNTNLQEFAKQGLRQYYLHLCVCLLCTVLGQSNSAWPFVTILTLHCVGKDKMSSLAFETCFVKKEPGVKTLSKILNFVNAERLYNVGKHVVSINLKASLKQGQCEPCPELTSYYFYTVLTEQDQIFSCFSSNPTSNKDTLPPIVRTVLYTHSDTLIYCTYIKGIT